MPIRKLAIILLLALTGAAPHCFAQSFSYDGNRWYEIEVSIFTNNSGASNNELVIPEKTDLSYPEPIRKLVPASSSFEVDFDTLNAEPSSEETFEENPAGTFVGRRERTREATLEATLEATRQEALEATLAGLQPETAPGKETVTIGPKNENGEGSFRVLNFDRDPFIALGEQEAEFTGYNLDLNQSGEHRLLYHAVWRQPVLNKSQATAILVTGGDQYGSHWELEGSLRFSYNVNRVDVEAKLWFLEFGVPFPGREFRWQVPPLPLQENAADGTRNPETVMLFGIEDLSYMNQMRAMVSNELHYLDHPALGMLVEIRPYQLPELTDFAFE